MSHVALVTFRSPHDSSFTEVKSSYTVEIHGGHRGVLRAGATGMQLPVGRLQTESMLLTPLFEEK